MNKLIIITTMLFLSFNGFAQLKQVGTVNRVTSRQMMIRNGLMDFTPPKMPCLCRTTTPVISFGGFYYIPNYRFFRSGMNINNYANTFMGVVSINGATPSIKGAKPNGTAYFINGERVYYLSETPTDFAGMINKFAHRF